MTCALHTALHNGDCLAIMPTLAADSVDAIVSDPPYGLAFMGKAWDHGVPGVEFWKEALRVAKPGAHLLAFGGTRTFHRLACAIEDAGWEIRDTIMWVYGSGFPKSHDVSKAIDKAAGADREREMRFTATIKGGALHAGKENGNGRSWNSVQSNLPATDAARQWQGWGTALKPAWEPIIVARKPFDGTVAQNVLAHGTGAINVDWCRVECEGKPMFTNGVDRERLRSSYDTGGSNRTGEMSTQGRWPANLIHDGSDEVTAGFPQTGASKESMRGEKTSAGTHAGWARESHKGFDSVRGHNDSGGSAARFFYVAKASKADRDEGCEGIPERDGGHYAQDEWSRQNMGNTPDAKREPRRNHHPTVKPTSLMRYLCRLVTPPGGAVLDPFMGSGSTGKAAVLEGFGFIGIELDAQYIEIARARIAHAANLFGQIQ